MSKALNSPTARLLRSSRLFSLPPPLPAPGLEAVTSGGLLRSSDTATLPYPTHQAISTPASSRHRGDWGLKRPLPNRAIPKSNAHLRITALDTLHHITDFSSAADHTQTVQKWQDMQIPMTMPQKRDSMSGASRVMATGAFEDHVDNTAFASSSAFDLDSTPISAERAMMLRNLPADQIINKKRWKTEGPWVNGLTEEEFNRYLTNTVRKNKAGFIKFLEQVKIQDKKKNLRQSMRDEGLLSDYDPRALEIELNKQSQLDEHELNDYIKELRDDNNGLSSELSRLVRQYFDLPAFPIANADGEEVDIDDAASGSARTRAASESANKNKDLLNAITNRLATRAPESPPATHPSAGLSYLRTSQYLHNHPIYGPQMHHEPIQARVIRPRSAQGVNGDKKAQIGVGGFVTEDSNSAGFNSNNRIRTNDEPTLEQQYITSISQLDVDTPGGNKVWVRPVRASVDEKGYVQLLVERASDQAVGVKIGKPVEAPLPPSARIAGRVNERLDSRPLPGTRGNANYGRALPDERSPRRDSRGFNAAELDRAREGQAQDGAEDPVKTIERLARQHLDESRQA